MLIRLPAGSKDPVYVQIAGAIARQINDGTVKAGSRLPPARVLAGTLGINMHTVLKAYSELESAGLVEKKRGRGGVIVAPETRMKALVDGLVGAAKARKLTKEELVELVEKSW